MIMESPPNNHNILLWVFYSGISVSYICLLLLFLLSVQLTVTKMCKGYDKHKYDFKEAFVNEDE